MSLGHLVQRVTFYALGAQAALLPTPSSWAMKSSCGKWHSSQAATLVAMNATADTILRAFIIFWRRKLFSAVPTQQSWCHFGGLFCLFCDFMSGPPHPPRS